MTLTIQWSMGAATALQVAEHLANCSDSYVPALTSRVNCSDYAQKITSLAICIEAWDGSLLVGLAAMYCNRHDYAFLTNVSVLPMYQRHGLGGELLQRCIAHAYGANIPTLMLEVDYQNHTAIRFYEKHNFSATEKGAIWRMQRMLSE